MSTAHAISQQKQNQTTLPKDKLPLLRAILKHDLGFHSQDSTYASHNFHAFAAKFPPQLPALFIEHLTDLGDTCLDPMMGSGTVLLEAALAGRNAAGFDIDPLALLHTRVKTTPIANISLLETTYIDIAQRAAQWLKNHALPKELVRKFDQKSREFLDYWFLPHTQLELMALWLAIEESTAELETTIREFFQLAFSAIIVTKSGGVSMARDLAHSRPHRVKDKTPRPALDQFRRRVQKNINSLAELNQYPLGQINITAGDARSLDTHLEDESIDLIVTSPPYAANAIDYMRAHKFSLVWFGHPITELGQLRSTYIGSERTKDYLFETPLPVDVQKIIQTVKAKDPKKARVLRKYLDEMRIVIAEMYRALKPNRCAIIVVGSSTMRGIDVRTHDCLASIAQSLQPGFTVAGIATRKLDRNKRMMPARFGKRQTSIEERMHEEYVIGLYKPAN